MFLPNTYGILFAKTGRNRHGEAVFAEGKPVECGVVRLSRVQQPTSVRADSSASRGNAQEFAMSAAKILFPATVTIAIGDRFKIASYDLVVTAREPRLSISGDLDHFECDFGIYEEDE
jgi:hypothetical protein